METFVISNYCLQSLRRSLDQARELLSTYEPMVKQGEFRKATQVWEAALSGSGYAVSSRTEPDGTVVLEANAFPTKSVSVRMNAATSEAQLEVNGSSRCVQDVKALQDELAARGMELTVTDWGKGEPLHLHRQASVAVSDGRMA